MLLSKSNLENICNEIRDSKRIVFTNGCFDLIHAGHCQYLNEAKKHGDILILGLNSDDSVKRLKGEDRPLNGEVDRAMVLSNLKPIDYVCIFEEDTPYNLIKALRPHVLVKGGDYIEEDIIGNDIAEKTIVLSFLEGRSTTRIIEKMK